MEGGRQEGIGGGGGKKVKSGRRIRGGKWEGGMEEMEKGKKIVKTLARACALTERPQVTVKMKQENETVQDETETIGKLTQGRAKNITLFILFPDLLSRKEATRE